MSTNGSHRSRAQYRPARRTQDSVADLSRLNAACPIGQANKRWVLRRIIDLNNDRHALREKKVSYKTMHERAGELRLFFDALWSLPRYAAVDPRSLRPKHIKAVLALWQARGLSPKTLCNRLSSLRTFAFWIGKRGLVETAANEGLHLKDLRVSQVATQDKSWRFRGVDAGAVIATAEKHCPYVAASLALIEAFGLRVKESVMSRPHEGVTPIEQANFYTERPEGVTHVLRVSGTKGGRPRELPIATEAQWAALRRAQVLVEPGQPMGRPGKTLKTNLQWMYRVLTKIGITRKQLGVTAHGLRHQKFNDEYERVTGKASPVRGGRPVDRELDMAAREHIAQIGGHGRIQIVSAYCGTSLRKRRTPSTDAPTRVGDDKVNTDSPRSEPEQDR